MTNTESTPMSNQQLVDEYRDAVSYYLSIGYDHPLYKQADKRCLQLELKAIQRGIDNVFGVIAKSARERMNLTGETTQC